jgi:hypothetical protein
MSITPSSNRIVAALSLAMLASMGAAAQAPTWSFSGYATAGVVHSDNDRADYLVDAFKPSGPGHTHDWSGEVDSRLGGQVTATFTPTLSAVLQVLVQQRYDESWEPIVEWANVKWQATDALAVRAGRVVLPLFMVTDARRVGYSNPWVRPPVEVYSLVPVTTNDGAEAIWRLHHGQLTSTLQLTAGRSDSRFPNSSGFDAGTAEARGIVALAASIEKGPLTVRANYGEARLTIAAFQPLFEAFRQFGPEGEAIAGRYSVDDRKVDFLGLGVNLDPGPWFAMAEWAQFDTHSIVGSRRAWYVSGGMRFGKWTPYATFASLRTTSDTSDPGLTFGGFVPPQVAPVVAQLNAALNAQLALGPSQETTSIGVRWDFWRNAALKVQYDRVDLGRGSFGTFGRVQPGFEPGGRVGIFSAAVDVVF